MVGGGACTAPYYRSPLLLSYSSPTVLLGYMRYSWGTAVLLGYRNGNHGIMALYGKHGRNGKERTMVGGRCLHRPPISLLYPPTSPTVPSTSPTCRLKRLLAYMRYSPLKWRIGQVWLLSLSYCPLGVLSLKSTGTAWGVYGYGRG